MSFETSIKKIDKRDWTILKDKWLSHIPTFSKIGEFPSHEILEFTGLNELYLNASRSSEYKKDVAILRQEILRESIFFMHKSIHVCGAANIHLENGVLSWGISSAYQSSFFALKGICGILGLSFPRINQALMIDCFPEDEKLSNKQRKRGDKPPQYLKFVTLPKLSHKHMWQIFQRILNTSEVSVWQTELLRYLRNLDVEKFAEQRNGIHYKNNYWLITEDLYDQVFDNDFGVDKDLASATKYEYLNMKKDYSFFINYLLVKMGIVLLKDLGTNATSVNDEYNLMFSNISKGLHNRLLSSISIP